MGTKSEKVVQRKRSLLQNNNQQTLNKRMKHLSMTTSRDFSTNLKVKATIDFIEIRISLDVYILTIPTSTRCLGLVDCTPRKDIWKHALYKAFVSRLSST